MLNHVIYFITIVHVLVTNSEHTITQLLATKTPTALATEMFQQHTTENYASMFTGYTVQAAV